MLRNGPLFYGGLLQNTGTELQFWDTATSNPYEEEIRLPTSRVPHILPEYFRMLHQELTSLSDEMGFAYAHRVAL
jgi:hypothetical protein